MPDGAVQRKAAIPPGEGPGLGLLSPRTRLLLELEVGSKFGSRDQFDDDSLEWRRLFSELLGTFALVLVAAGGGILHGQGHHGRNLGPHNPGGSALSADVSPIGQAFLVR
jgi:hypothetical protein